MNKINETLLSLTDAGIYRDKRWLVQNINLELRRGEIVTLIGPNGSGKSTTAKMVLGILSPDSGQVWRKEGLKVGYVPQKLAIDRSMPLTVARLMRLTAASDIAAIRSVLDEVGILHLEKAQVSQLSGGELQRALLARAILSKPNLLVLDEPLQGIDYSGESELYALIASLRSRLNCAILLISHDLHIVMASTNWVLCLNGHICCSGPPETVAASQAYSALLGGRSQLAPYKHHHNHAHSLDGHIYEPDHSSDQSIINTSNEKKK